MTILYAYGTLRTGRTDNLTSIKGKLYDLGSFPGLRLSSPDCTSTVIIERIVTEKPIDIFDMYEGYNPNDPASSFYLRHRFQDGWIYEFNDRLLDSPAIEHGCWLKHCEEKGKGKLYGRFSL